MFNRNRHTGETKAVKWKQMKAEKRKQGMNKEEGNKKGKGKGLD